MESTRQPHITGSILGQQKGTPKGASISKIICLPTRPGVRPLNWTGGQPHKVFVWFSINFCYHFYLPNLIEIIARMMYTPGQGGDDCDRA